MKNHVEERLKSIEKSLDIETEKTVKLYSFYFAWIVKMLQTSNWFNCTYKYKA